MIKELEDMIMAREKKLTAIYNAKAAVGEECRKQLDKERDKLLIEVNAIKEAITRLKALKEMGCIKEEERAKTENIDLGE